eukprot:11021176-Lingulodinium_polyedra.AAC.1
MAPEHARATCRFACSALLLQFSRLLPKRPLYVVVDPIFNRCSRFNDSAGGQLVEFWAIQPVAFSV